MKKCPSCDKTYEDSMRFCQVDGTPLVGEAPPPDPYKTMVARSEDLPVGPSAEPISEAPPVEPVAVSPVPEQIASPIVTPPISEPEEVLDIPGSADPLKTMYVSDEEMRQALGGLTDQEDPKMEVPSASDLTPEPPEFIASAIPPQTAIDPQHELLPFAAEELPEVGSPEPAAPAATEPSPAAAFDATNPPIPSPFDEGPVGLAEASQPSGSESSAFNEPETMIQPFPPASPFSDPQPSVSTPEPVLASASESEPEPVSSPEPPPFKEPEPFQPAVVTPIQQDQSPAAWTPPPAPDASWQNQEIGQNTPFQPPPAGGNVNQTLPIISLILGVVSLCCYISPITGIAALITGYLGLKNIKNDPNAFGGRGLAIAGMITGGVFGVIAVLYWIFIILVYMGIVAGSLIPGR